MSNNDHDWQITDNEESVPIKIVSSSPDSDVDLNKFKSLSRKPAAIAGILIVVAISSFLLKSPKQTIGQLTDSSIIVVITETSLEPSVITAQPGDTITWINQQDIPHYLVSNTLCSSSEECMTTSTVFAGAETSYTIPVTATSGSHTYFSPTDSTLIGTISITGGNPPLTGTEPTVSSSSSSSSAEPTFSAEPSNDPVFDLFDAEQDSSDSSSSSNSSSSASKNPLLESIERQLELDRQTSANTNNPNTAVIPQNTAPIPGVPQNPYAMGGGQNPVPTQYQDNPGAYLGANVQKPFQQPNTGIGTWTAILVSILSLYLLMKHTRGSVVIKK